MKRALVAVMAVLSFSSCSTSYPYLVTTDGCQCERFTYKDAAGRFEIEVSARYEVTDRVNSTIELLCRNRSRDSLSLRQAFLRGASTNISYQFNDRFQPMPFVVIPPGGAYSMTLQGSDPQPGEDPWLKIAGEKIVLEIRGMLLGLKPLSPVVLTFVPYNPKLSPQGS